VIYLGLRSTAEEIMAAATQEDVDLIGASVLSGAHIELVSDLLAERSRHDLDGTPLVVGGIVPPGDVDRLLQLGVDDVFPAGTALTDVVSRVMALADRSLR
jgi:methylmalonyl-CoA mutase C-terminal domain/subunit